MASLPFGIQRHMHGGLFSVMLAGLLLITYGTSYLGIVFTYLGAVPQVVDETLTSPKLDEAYAAMGMRSHIMPPNIFNVVGFELMQSNLLKSRKTHVAFGACESAWGIKDADIPDIMDGNVGNAKPRKLSNKFLKMFGPFFDSGTPLAKVPSFTLLEVRADRQPL